MATEGKVHPDCINASNPYHECVDYCYTKIAEAKARAEEEKQDRERIVASRTVHPECINASNPYHECTEYCYSRIAKLRAPAADDSGQSSEDEQHAQNVSSEDKQHAQNVTAEGIPILTEKQAKMDKLEKLLKGAREANLQAVMDEKQELEAPSKPRGISKKEWLEERKEKLGTLLKANGLDISKAYMLDTQEAAEAKYKKWEKDPAPFGWDVFNQKTLYKAHKERTKNIECDMEAYTKAKEADPEFYREASSLQYGKVPKVPEENVDRMVKELRDREAKRKNFSRRRKFHDEKDIDSINDRNEHFNKKIERFFGKYTAEIKNNLERGTALPD